MQNLTPYACAKIVNTVIDDLNKEGHELKNLPPQMFYNYVSKGMIPSTDKKVSEDDLQAWMVKYFTKKGIELATN